MVYIRQLVSSRSVLITKINCHFHKVAPPISNRFALSNHKRAESIPCAGYRVQRPQAQRPNGHSWQLLRCSKHIHDTPSTWHKQAPSSKHMAQANIKLQAHGTSKHQAPSTWHAACLPRGETRCPHSAEYWQDGGPRSSSGHATEFAECVCRSKFPPPHMYLVVAGQWNFMVYRCSDQIGSAYNAALSTLSYLVRARLGNRSFRHILSSKNLDTLFLVGQVRCTK